MPGVKRGADNASMGREFRVAGCRIVFDAQTHWGLGKKVAEKRGNLEGAVGGEFVRGGIERISSQNDE